MFLGHDKAFSSLLMASAGALAAGYFYWWRQVKYKRRSYELPERWTAIGRVSNILMYPLKSGYYKELDSGVCELRGIEELSDGGRQNILRDRNFIIFDKDKRRFITAKVYARIVLVDMTIRDEDTVQFIVRTGDYQPLVLNITQVRHHARAESFKMHFNEVVRAFDCGDEASDWFSVFLLNETNRNIRLGMCCEFERTIENSWDKYTSVYNLLSDDDTGRFSDIASYMIVNEESIKDLNEKVGGDTYFSSHYFRPNIVIKDCIPYEEDTWDWVKIGETIFRVVKPCTRCIAITIDPETAIKNPVLEPMRTLRTYRRLGDIDQTAKRLEGQSPVMGVYAGMYQPGVIRNNDVVFVSSHQRD